MADLRELTEADLDAVQALMERCRDYYVLTTGAGARATAARDLWDALPPQTLHTAKLTLGVYETDLVGIVDVVRCWPRMGTWLIGLLLLDPDARRHGVGAGVVAAIDARAAGAGADTLRVAVIDSNPMALAFWRRLGFAEVPATLPGAIALERFVLG